VCTQWCCVSTAVECRKLPKAKALQGLITCILQPTNAHLGDQSQNSGRYVRSTLLHPHTTPVPSRAEHSQ
jgi:hypothetical protein